MGQLAGPLKGCVLFGGIDVLPMPDDAEAAIGAGTYPSFGFAIDADGAIHGPWRQVSTTDATRISPLPVG